MHKPLIWGAWVAGTVGLTAYFALALTGEDRSVFLIGATTQGHHQIELACDACHTSAFGGTEALQESCVGCHGAELKAADDKHPKTKFTDPRNADRVAQLDARVCVTCHREHRPGITEAMGLTLPEDYCFKCHQDVGKDRPSHLGLAYESCASAGCHNFHDNRALYEDFLAAHLHEPETRAEPVVAVRAWSPDAPAWAERAKPALTRAALGGIPEGKSDAATVAAWEASQHARAGVGCDGCHRGGAAAAAWVDRPGHDTCATCHGPEAEGFVASRHGMRLDDRLEIALGPMSPALARIPMKAAAHDATLGCATCHDAHGPDTVKAAAESCMGCHDDDHTRNFPTSRHAALWQAEQAGEGAAGSGVSCATCHLPRETHESGRGPRVLVQHNQNANLRPNEKMVRGVCLNCHGLGFALDALADPEVIRTNFAQRPSMHVESLDWVERRQAARDRPTPDPERQTP